MWEVNLRSEKVIFSLLKKLWSQKYPSNRFNHLSMTSASIFPSNMGMLNLTCTLKGVVPPEWLLDEDVPSLGSCWMIYAKLSIITSFVYQGPPWEIFWYDLLLPHIYFHPPWASVGFCKADIARFHQIEPSLLIPRPCWGCAKKDWEEVDRSDNTDPDLCRNTTEYTYNHKYKDAVEITLYFINIKELKFAYR